MLVLAALAAAVVAAAFWPVHFPLDDAYITLHNARSLIEGVDPLYGQNPLVGATSPVHLLAVTTMGLALALPNASLVVSVVSVAAYAAGLWRWGWKIAVIGLTVATVPLQLFNGLETPMAMAAVTWAILWMDDRKLPVLAGLMPFIRPELGLLSAILMGRDVYLRRDWRPVAVSAMVALPLVAWCYWATGHVLPNTVAAKIAFFHDEKTFFQGLESIVASAHDALITPLLFAAPFLVRRPGGRALLLFLAGWMLSVALTFSDAMWANYGRYWAIAVPVLCYGLPRLGQWPMLVVALLSMLFFQLTTKEHDPWPAMTAAAKQLPAGSTVLIHDAGEIAYANPPLKLVDVVGLKTPSSAEIMAESNVRACQWTKALDRIATDSHAQYAVVLNDPFWGCIATNLRDAGWTLTPVFSDPDGFSIYKIDKRHMLFPRAF